MKKKIEFEIRSEKYETVRGSLLTDYNESLENIKERIAYDNGYSSDNLIVEKPNSNNLTESTVLVVLREGRQGSFQNHKEHGESSIVFEEESVIERTPTSEKVISFLFKFMYKEPEMPPRVIGPVKRCFKLFMCLSSSKMMMLNYEGIKFYPYYEKEFAQNYESEIKLADILEVTSYRKANIYFIKIIKSQGERIDLRFDTKEICREWLVYFNKALEYHDYLSEKMNYYKVESFDKFKQSLSLKESKINVIKLDGSTQITKGYETIESSEKLNESNTIIKNSQKLIRLADFEISHVIGTGAFSTVYKAERNGRVYALKQINKDKLIEENQLKYAMTELNILKKCRKCPFIVPLYHSFQTENYLYLALKYLPFGTLKNLIEKKVYIPMQMAMNVLCELVYTLEFLHSQQILYRDLKPENILLDKEGHICLIDFGLSIELEEGQEFAESFVGTPLYLAPEWVEGTGRINHKADIFGVGCIFYLMLHGHAPFEGDDLPSIIYNIKNSQARIKKGVDDLVEDFLKQALETNVDKRLNCMSSHPLFENVDWEKIKSKQKTIMNLTEIKQDGSLLGGGIGDQDYTEENYPNKKINDWNFNADI